MLKFSAPAARFCMCAAALVVVIYAMTRIDLVLRARAAYLEGEKWLEWSRRPELKQAHFDAELSARMDEFSAELAQGKFARAAYVRKTGLARFERDQAMAESSLQYAYVWYQTAAELFSPPENRWSIRARGKMNSTRVLWKEELEVQHVRYQDYMLE